ncbi:hypothetical protein E8E12_000477 [Didymella heteroderae]|uniref:Uncharacterized protein n=1 Tax=Didymella heteroderae TaxID=1769908 RepID=A0A9P4WFD7_9PLEO|nr:hypothetical protein E8E12_000477 [Didymella heteroderae]
MVSYHESYTHNPVSPVDVSSFDNHEPFPSNLLPRRSASDASSWRNRQGQQNWEKELQTGRTRNGGNDWGVSEDIARTEKDGSRQEWRERGNLLVTPTSDDEFTMARVPTIPSELSVPSADQWPCAPAVEGDWDAEAATERRVVQVLFTVPKPKLRVVNADPDGSSILSMPR